VAEEIEAQNAAVEDDVQWLEKRLADQDKVLQSLVPILEKISNQLESNNQRPVNLTEEQMETLRTVVEIAGNQVNSKTQTRLESLLEKLENQTPRQASLIQEPSNNQSHDPSESIPSEQRPENQNRPKKQIRSFRAI
jgi:hypothetical protein